MIELVVAMMILGLILVLLATVQLSALVTVTEARKLQQATAFANEAVEQMHAIPWNTLSRGMYSDFESVSGGDELVTAGVLNVDGTSVPLIIAPSSNDQDLGDPARPLFDDTGSNVQIREDPSLTGVEFKVRAYVTDSSGGASVGIVGIVVVVEWPNRHGGVSRTTVWSEAYRGGVTSCGDANTQPFLAACQSFFEASAGSGDVTAEISASNVDLDPALVVAEPLMYPATAPEYSLSMRSAGAAASIRSQQVTYADGIIQFGGNTTDDNNPSVPADQRGFAVYTLRATDDMTNDSGWLPNPFPDLTVTQGTAAESERTVTQSSSPVSLRARSDYARPGTADASMTVSCLAGIPANQPCALSSLGNAGSDILSGSGYILMDLDGQVFRISRRLSLGLDVTNGNVDKAWVARFISAPGTAAVGCTTLSGAGCISAGSTRTMAPLNIGRVVNSSWNGSAAEGMVMLEGAAGCPASQNGFYGESVLAQRGVNQTTTAPNYSRCGQIRYWDGTGYSSVSINDTPISHITSPVTIDTAPVTWTSNDYTVVGTSQVQILPVYVNNPTPIDPDCQTNACTVSVSAGSIIIVSTYDITWPGHEHLLIVTTTVTSPSAQATFTAAPHVS